MKKKWAVLALVALALIILSMLTGCAGAGSADEWGLVGYSPGYYNRGDNYVRDRMDDLEGEIRTNELRRQMDERNERIREQAAENNERLSF